MKNFCLIPLASHERRPIEYVDLTLTVDVRPDDNGCCWLRLRHVHGDVDDHFDIQEREVAGLIAALKEWQHNHELYLRGWS